MVEDIFTLKKQQDIRREHRISRALKGDTGIQRQLQIDIARWLYEAFYESHHQDDIIDSFCLKVFGCDFDEVIVAYDRFLG